MPVSLKASDLPGRISSRLSIRLYTGRKKPLSRQNHPARREESLNEAIVKR